MEFLEESFKAAARKGTGGSEADGSSESGDGKSNDEGFRASKPAIEDLEGDGAEHDHGGEKESERGDSAASDSDDASSVGVRGRDTRGGRGGETGEAAREPPDGLNGRSAQIAGFGVVGEDDTVELALQALSKVCVCVCACVWYSLLLLLFVLELHHSFIF